MKKIQIRFIVSAFCLASVLMSANSALAAPVRLNQVLQIINAKPGKANTGNFSQLRLINDYTSIVDDDDDDTTTPVVPQDDDRVITDTRTEIVEDEVCDCEQTTRKRKPPYWIFAFAAVPLLFLIPGKDRKKTPTPVTETPTMTPTVTMTPTPTETPKTPTPTPTTPPEPVPEPMTLLLFGTGLAGIGIAARKKFGKKQKTTTEN